jgi:hypothetical protein
MARKKKKSAQEPRPPDQTTPIEPRAPSANVGSDAGLGPETATLSGSSDPVDTTSLRLLRLHGGAFVTRFLKAHPGAIAVPSKEPAVCWGASGVVNFAAVIEFSGPNSLGDDSPLLFRIRSNMYPPAALCSQLESEAVRHKLGVRTPPEIAKEPALELTALPEEVEEFGAWIPTWYDDLSRRAPRGPKPPIPLLSWGVNEDLTERLEDFVTVGSEWHMYLYLWTPRAVQLFSPWFQVFSSRLEGDPG